MTCQTRQPDMEDVYSTYFAPVYNYVFYKLLNREQTEDIVSQVFMKVCAGLTAFDPAKASVKTWIFRITDNALVDFYRRRRSTVSFDADTGLDNVLHVHFDDEYERRMEPERRAVLSALRQLPERDRTLIYYRYYLEISNREIARRMNLNENTVAAILARARQKLRGILADEL